MERRISRRSQTALTPSNAATPPNNIFCFANPRKSNGEEIHLVSCQAFKVETGDDVREAQLLVLSGEAKDSLMELLIQLLDQAALDDSKSALTRINLLTKAILLRQRELAHAPRGFNPDDTLEDER
jgi:hypothetical protein